MNKLTDRQHLENITAITDRGGYQSYIVERVIRYLYLIGMSSDSSYSYITVDQLNEIIPNKL